MELNSNISKEEVIENFKINQVQFAEDLLIKDGTIMPIVGVLCYDKEKGYGMVQAPIMGDIDSASKDVIVEYVIPKVFDEIKEKGLVPVCFSFTSEAWLRTREKKEDNLKEFTMEQIEALPKEEALMLFFETKEDSEMRAFIIKRDGQSINEDGDLVDNIKLTPHELPGKGTSFSGRFTGILKQYLDD